MNPEDLLYEAYASTFENPYDSQEFSTMLKNDGEFVNEVFGTLYNYSDEVRTTIDGILSGKINFGGIDKDQEGNLTYETNEDFEARQKREKEIETFVPKMTSDNEIDFKYYEGLSLMEKEKDIFTEWLKRHPEADPSASDVNNYPTVPNQVGVELNYDPSEYIGAQIKNVLEEEKAARDKKLKEDAEIYEAEEIDAPIVEQVFNEEAPS